MYASSIGTTLFASWLSRFCPTAELAVRLLTPQAWVGAGVGECGRTLRRHVCRLGRRCHVVALAKHGCHMVLDGALGITVSQGTVASQLCKVAKGGYSAGARSRFGKGW